MVFYIVPAVIVVLLLLYVLSLRGKGRKPGFYGLAAYDYAHRGLHDSEKGVPENSLAAFRLAVENGYGAELDVHLSKDGRLVVMHDESLLRTAGVDKNICDCTAEELDRLTLEGTGEHIPYLEEVLPLFEGKTPLVVEIKAFRKNHAVLTERVCALLDQYPGLQFCMESFDPRVLLWLKKHRPEVIRGQLSQNFIRRRSGLSLPLAWLLTNLCTNFLTTPHFIAYCFRDRKQPALRLSKKLWGVQEFSWTLRTAAEVSEAKQHGALPIFEHCRPE